MMVWLSIRVMPDGKSETNGIFSTEEKAAAACPEWNDCISEWCLDEAMPQESMLNGTSYFPQARAAGIEHRCTDRPAEQQSYPIWFPTRNER